jgi:hypothetical protein
MNQASWQAAKQHVLAEQVGSGTGLEEWVQRSVLGSQARLKRRQALIGSEEQGGAAAPCGPNGIDGFDNGGEWWAKGVHSPMAAAYPFDGYT